MNIETYLESLPDNIKKIDVSNRGLTNLDVTRFKMGYKKLKYNY